jgi:hypothetical protein
MNYTHCVSNHPSFPASPHRPFNRFYYMKFSVKYRTSHIFLHTKDRFVKDLTCATVAVAVETLFSCKLLTKEHLCLFVLYSLKCFALKEDGGGTFHRNIGVHVPTCTAPKLASSSSQPWKPQILQRKKYFRSFVPHRFRKRFSANSVEKTVTEINARCIRGKEWRTSFVSAIKKTVQIPAQFARRLFFFTAQSVFDFCFLKVYNHLTT